MLSKLAPVLVLLWVLPASAAEVGGLGGHFQDQAEFSKVLDARCTVCHTRERVDAAFRENRDFEKIVQQMIERGAVVDERDKKVLGTFWGTPLKEKE
jgi:hypothetical protein